MNDYGEYVKLYCWVKSIEVPGDELSPLEIPHGLARDLVRPSAVL